ncbi:hypothetical protein N0V90_008591 [Kalmusia sp. IMI 367209]|nr:hypothetical protein N0V90_008591 [Kalmusia sp. IMI 367209]
MSNDDASPAATTPGSSSTPGPTPSPTSAPPVKQQVRPSSSRALVPTPLSTNLTPITTAASPTGQPSPVGGGPTSNRYVVPPRPKPGRKPATDEPASKRKAQNRESQRAFRARKAAKLTEMATQVEEAQQKHRDEINAMFAEIHRLQNSLKDRDAQFDELNKAMERVNKERDYWKDRCTQAEAHSQSLEQRLRDQNYPLNAYSDQHATLFPRRDSPTRASMASFSGYSSPKAVDISCGNCKLNGDCACISEMAQGSLPNHFAGPIPPINPPRTTSSPIKDVQFQTVDAYADREIDFTAQFASKRSKVDQRPSVSLMAHNNDDANCGFCTDPSNCLCRDQSLQFQDVQRGNEDIVPISNSSKLPAATRSPGSCADCQKNPLQRAWCQRIAQLKHEDFLPSPSSRNSSIGSALETMEPHIPDASTPYGGKQSIGCNEAYKLLDGRVPMDQDRLDWISNLKQVSPHARRDTLVQHSRKYSALEIDTAGIIATLGNTMKPLQPRDEDGENADIVRIAQEVQRRTQSPYTTSA